MNCPTARKMTWEKVRLANTTKLVAGVVIVQENPLVEAKKFRR